MGDYSFKIEMFGGFTISYDDKPLLLWQNRSGKTIGLLQFLIFHRGVSYPKEELFEILYDYGYEGDPSNTFRVTVHRIKKMLIEAGLPEKQYITSKNGMCGWQVGDKTFIDALEFEALIKEAELPGKNPDEKLVLLQKALELYKGEFLSNSSTLSWVTVESVRYKKLYINCVHSAAELRGAMCDYKTALEIYEKAGLIYPYDEELQIGRISSLLSLKRYREALSVFESVSEMYFQELGLKPSENLIALYQKISEHIPGESDNIHSIKEYLDDDVNGDGAYYCNFLTFVDGYRFVMRIIERSGQSAFLMLCSLGNSEGRKLEDEKLTEASSALHKAIKSSLRRGDLYTRYNPNQFLVLLLGLNLENCSGVAHRIAKRFRETFSGRGCKLRYRVVPASTFNSESSVVKFKTGSIKW